MDKFDMWVEKFEESANRFMSRLTLFITTDRRSPVVAKVLLAMSAIGVSLYVTQIDVGKEIFRKPEFLLLIFIWGLFGIVVFLDELKLAKDKKTDDKIDDLVTEVKGMRDDLQRLLGGNKDEAKNKPDRNNL